MCAARFGSALDGQSMTAEMTQLLALLMEPANADGQFWLVDWLWGVYRDALQPFLVLAGPASGGAAMARFRECWACLPWARATFHCASPGAPAPAPHAEQGYSDAVTPIRQMIWRLLVHVRAPPATHAR